MVFLISWNIISPSNPRAPSPFHRCFYGHIMLGFPSTQRFDSACILKECRHLKGYILLYHYHLIHSHTLVDSRGDCPLWCPNVRKNTLCVPNRILQLVYLNTVHFNTVLLLCSALILTRVVLSQIMHCCFALTGSDNGFFQPPLLLLLLLFSMANCKQYVDDYHKYFTAIFCHCWVHLTCIRMFHSQVLYCIVCLILCVVFPFVPHCWL